MMPRVEVKFPLKGINKNWANSEQPPITSPDMNNVRPLIGGTFNPIVAMCVVHTVVS
jgi:hypothetical protein